MNSRGLTSIVFDVVNMDCECCEYMVIPENKDIFSDNIKVKSMVVELHPFPVCGKNTSYQNLHKMQWLIS